MFLLPSLDTKTMTFDTKTMTSAMSSSMRLCNLDPPKYGWTATGGIRAILEPHEVRPYILCDDDARFDVLRLVLSLFGRACRFIFLFFCVPRRATGGGLLGAGDGRLA
jgi:hypothetical protein